MAEPRSGGSQVGQLKCIRLAERRAAQTSQMKGDRREETKCIQKMKDIHMGEMKDS
jgi:hypothetical protein